MAVKTISLLSGGLDSVLATRIMQKLGFHVVVLNFTSPFCTCTKKSSGCKNEAKRLADELGMKARVEFLGEEYIDIVRSPKFGYGKNMNPCVDCRIMIFKRAKEVMEEEGAAFIFTGEVVGQRNKSQKIAQMNIIDRESGLIGMVVRPLSAKLLPPTIAETKGLIDREKMLDIQGKSRKEQIRIARDDYGMTENLCSSGGCLLTDPHFSGKMRDLVTNDLSAGVKDARLLRTGRHFRLSGELKLIVGRDEGENALLERMAAPDDFIFYPKDIPGPMALAKGKLSREAMEIIGGITARYCDTVNGDPVKIEYRQKENGGAFNLLAYPTMHETIEEMRV